MARRVRKDGEPYAPNPWHQLLMDCYDAAAHAWWLEAERVTMLYPTELAEHRETNPRPQLRDYMINLSPIYRHNHRERQQ